MSERGFLVTFAVFFVYNILFGTREEALISAIRHNNIFLVKQLLAKSLMVTLFCKKSDSLLHKAAISNQAELMQALFENSSKLLIDCNARNSAGETPLHNAVLWGYVPVVQVLLEQPTIDILALSYDNWSAAEYAARFDRIEILRLLLAHAYKRNFNEQELKKWHLICISAYTLAQSFGHANIAAVLAKVLINLQSAEQLDLQHYTSAFTLIEDFELKI